MRVWIIAALALPLVSCAATMHWEKPGASTADFDADKARCEYEAQLATPSSPVYSTGDAITSGISEGMRLGQLQQLCMKAKGWAMVSNNAPAPQPPPVVATPVPDRTQTAQAPPGAAPMDPSPKAR